MKVTTNINRIDLIRLNLTLIPRLKSTYISILIYGVLIFAFLVWLHGIPNDVRDWGKVLIGAICGGVGAILVGILYSLISILLMSSKKNGILGGHEYKLTSEGLFEKTDANEGLSKWSGIAEVKEIGDFLFFKINGYLFSRNTQTQFPKQRGI